MPPDPATGRAGVGHRAAAGEGERLREQLLDAAEAQLIARGSIQAVSLRQVARDVGVSATSVYLHFSDKDDLFLAVCTRRFIALGELLREARVGHRSAVDQLRAAGHAYVRFGLDHPGQYHVLFGGGVPMEVVKERLPEEERVGLQVKLELAGVIQRGIEAGEFRPVDPIVTTVSLWATVHGLVEVLTHGTGTDTELPADLLVDQTMDLLLQGLQADT